MWVHNKKMKEMRKLKEQAEEFLMSKFRIIPEKSTLTIYKPKEWKEFIRNHGLRTEARGLYLAGSYTAHIPYGPVFPTLLFHEYFGHGLYFEHTPTGQQVHSLESRLKLDRAREFYNAIRNEPLKKHDTESELRALEQQKYDEFEGFAMWMEGYLSENTGYLNLFCNLLDNHTNEHYKKLFNEFLGYHKRYGEHALMYSLGFPKHYDTKIIKAMVCKIFGNDLKDSDTALLYGSKKPESDIDLFIVSNSIKPMYEGWIDVSAVTKKDLEYLTSQLDISVTDPLFTGEYICGDRSYLEQMKQRILDAEITPEMISYSKKQAEIARILGMRYDSRARERHNALRFNKSYLMNARELEQGRKALTLKELIRRYPEEL